MSIKIAIPSKGRVDFPAKELFKSIPQEVFVFVNPSEYELYKNNNLFGYNIINVEQEKNLTYVMEYINGFFDEERFVLVDDDVSKLFIRDGLTKGNYPKLVELKDITRMLADADRVMGEYGIALLCMREVQSNWYSKSVLELAKVGYRVVFFDGTAIQKNNLHYDGGIHLNSDVEFYIQMAKTGLKIGTYYKYAFGSKSEQFDTEGGCAEAKTKDYTLNDCLLVWNKYKGDINIKIKLHPKFKRYGIICDWKALSPIDYWSKICV